MGESRMESVRLGIVGVGNMGSAHANSIAAGHIQGLELSAVCDIDEAKRDWARDHLPGVPFFSQYEDLLDSGVDAVLVATPHYLHPVVAAAAFRKGLHVLSEKPAGVYTAQVEEMNEAARRSGRVFGLMFNQRTSPLFQKARDLVQSGELGEPKRFVWIITNWYRSQAYYDSGSWRATWAGEGGGVLLNQAPHNLDLWQWIFGMPKRVRGFCTCGKYHHIEVEDDATIYAEYENGAVATFITTTGEAPGTNRLEISGDRGKLVIENGELTVWRLSAPEREICFTAREGYPRLDTAVESWRPQAKETAHNGILQNFTNAILYGEELLAPGVEGLNSLMISNAAYLSSWTGQTVDLPLDGALYYRLLQEKVHHSSVKNRPRAESVPQGRYNARWSVKW